MATLKDPITLVAAVTATSANGVDVPGATLPTNDIRPGTLSAKTITTIVTGSVVSTFRWQVSANGSTWLDHVVSNNAANVTNAATVTRAIDAPAGIMGWNYCRIVATLSGAVTAAGDTTGTEYHYRVYGQSP